jgi:hypothetical protein
LLAAGGCAAPDLLGDVSVAPDVSVRPHDADGGKLDEGAGAAAAGAAGHSVDAPPCSDTGVG